MRKLSQVWRGKLLDKPGRACEHAPLPGRGPNGKRPLRQAACQRRWVAYCKAPLAGPEQVLGYLSRYTHRIAIGNERPSSASCSPQRTDVGAALDAGISK